MFDRFSLRFQGVSNNTEAQVLILGATNMPNQLDPAIRRRFDKRIYIALPDAASRGKMFKIHLGDTPHNLTEEDFRGLGQRTEGFSGSDVNQVVKDTLMQPVRKVQDATHFRCSLTALRILSAPIGRCVVIYLVRRLVYVLSVVMAPSAMHDLPASSSIVLALMHLLDASALSLCIPVCRPAKGPNGKSGYWEPCAPSAPGAEEKDLMWFGTNNFADKVLVPPITVSDFHASLQRARPTVSQGDLERYEKFTAEFGEEGV